MALHETVKCVVCLRIMRTCRCPGPKGTLWDICPVCHNPENRKVRFKIERMLRPSPRYWGFHIVYDREGPGNVSSIACLSYEEAVSLIDKARSLYYGRESNAQPSSNPIWRLEALARSCQENAR